MSIDDFASIFICVSICVVTYLYWRDSKELRNLMKQIRREYLDGDEE